MARRAFLTVEELEGRALLSGLSYRLTTDKPVYQVGEPIQMTFTETNTGDQPLTVNLDPTDFIVTSQGGYSPTWESDPGDQGPLTTVTLQPGQSYTERATWDGTTPSQGTSVAQWGTFAVSDPNGPQGVTATFQITDPLTYSLTTDQSVYQVGEPVQISYTETNTSDEPVLFDGGVDSGLSVMQDGVVVGWPDTIWPVLSEPIVVEPVALEPVVAEPDQIETLPAILPGGVIWPIGFGGTIIQPGTSYTQTSTWDGMSTNVPPSILSGAFTVSNAYASAAFQIATPPAANLSTSVTTDQSVYQVGEPIQLTYTETNNGDQPATIIVGGGFNITQGENQVWSSESGGLVLYSALLSLDPFGQDYHWVTLQPGQSYTDSATWYGIPQGGSLVAAGTFVVSHVEDPQQSTATFQIEGVAYSLTTDQPSYNVAAPVQITFTETNTGDQPLTIDPDDISFNITLDGNWIWGDYPYPYWSHSTVTLQPGASYSQTVTWDGIPAEAPYDIALNPSGTFVVSVPGIAQQATFQVTDPHLTYTLTTDKSIYDSGEPVQITFTETNTGDEPVTIAPDLVLFNLMQDGSWIWDGSASGWCCQPTVTLQPGQSYSETVTWDGISENAPNDGTLNASGQFVVSVEGTSQQATFQVLAPQIAYSLTTDKSVYYSGEPVQITFTEINTGDQPVTIDPALLNFSLTHDGSWIWEDSPYAYWNLSTVTLQPGQSYAQTVTWDGIPEYAPYGVAPGVSGTFVISVAGTSQQATFQVFAPQIVYSLTTDKPVYSVGEAVQITLTETNTGDQPVAIVSDPLAVGITLDGSQIWGNYDYWYNYPTTVTLQPGQSYSETVTWDGIPDAAHYDIALNPSGTFFVSVAGISQQATFQVADPQLTYTLTTDKSVYDPGEPVHITFTETNNGDEPVTVDPAFVIFNLMQDGSSVWQGSSPSWCSQTPVTLQPGASFSETVTWDDMSYGGAISLSGTFVVSLAGTAQQATFQFLAPQIVYNLTTDKSVYDSGESVLITLTETNTGDQPVTIDPDDLTFNITLEGFEIWWHSAPWWRHTPVTLQPGQSYTRTVKWGGNTESPWQGVPPGALGTAIVSVPGTSQQATFQIVAASAQPSSSSDQPPDLPATTSAVTAIAVPEQAVDNPAQPVLGSPTIVDPDRKTAARSPDRIRVAAAVFQGPTWAWTARRSLVAWSAPALKRYEGLDWENA